MKNYYSFIFQIGAIFVLIGAATYITHWTMSPYIMTVGALAVGVSQALTSYTGKDIVIKRLYRQQLFGALFLLISGVLMFTLPRGNEWILALTIGSILQLYTAFRLPQEEKKKK